MQTVKEQEQIEREGGMQAEGYLAIPLGCFGPRWKVKESFKGAEVDREVQVPYATIMGLVQRARESCDGFRTAEYGPPNDEEVLIMEPGDEMDEEPEVDEDIMGGVEEYEDTEESEYSEEEQDEGGEGEDEGEVEEGINWGRENMHR
jgi:hypothetical protein